MDRQDAEEFSAELRRLAEEQINDIESESAERVERSRVRRERVLALYAQGALITAQDHYHAAMVMLYGTEVPHFELSRAFAKRAAELGEMRAWSIIAAAWDRSLQARGLPQRYGTQFYRKNGRWTLGQIDPRVTDSERAMYGVPPLWVLKQHLEQLQRREDEQ